jgi:hypothetical protein
MPPSYLVLRYFLHPELERRRVKNAKKVQLFTPGNRMLCSQKSLVFDVAAAQLPELELFKKLNFYRGLNLTGLPRLFKKLNLFRLTQNAGEKKLFKKLNFFRLTPGAGGGKNASDFYVFYDLMHSLAAQVKLVSNLAERISRRAHLQNLGISRRIRCRPWLQRSPLPTRNSLDCCRAFVRKLIFSATLPHVSDPSSQSDVGSVNIFYMNRWNIAMSFTCRKLLQGFDVCIEACSVVHIHNSIRGPLPHVDEPETVLHPLRILRIKEIL